MKLKDKVKTYSFWVSLTSAVILILKLISTQLGFSFDEKFASDLITTLCSILVILGIIVTPTSKQNEENETVKITSSEVEESKIEENFTDEFSEKVNLQEIQTEENITYNQDVLENQQIEIAEQTSDKSVDFENLLALKKEDFSDDINRYIEILQNQINSIVYKNND